MLRQACSILFSVLLLLTLGICQSGSDEFQLSCLKKGTACPSGTENGVLLVAKSTGQTKKTTSGILAFGTIDDAYKQTMAFRPGYGPAYEPNLDWAGPPKQVPLIFPERRQLPVRIWVICADDSGTCASLSADDRTYLRDAIANANVKLNDERVGVELIPAPGGDLISNEIGTPGNPTDLAEFDKTMCSTLHARVTPGRILTTALNIYVVSKVDKSSGKGTHCSIDTAKAAVIGSTVDWTTILHEVGHMLSLGHVEPFASSWDTPPKENFMYGNTNESTRKFFTEGQTFRIHLGWDSAVSTILGSPTGERRDCGSTDAKAKKAEPPCPKLESRVWNDQ